jgi:hypothetical protein
MDHIHTYIQKYGNAPLTPASPRFLGSVTRSAGLRRGERWCETKGIPAHSQPASRMNVVSSEQSTSSCESHQSARCMAAVLASKAQPSMNTPESLASSQPFVGLAKSSDLRAEVGRTAHLATVPLRSTAPRGGWYRGNRSPSAAWRQAAAAAAQ